MTDEELDALVKRLRKMDDRMSFQSVDIEGAMACRLAADTITTLRAQLAEVQAELVRRVDMHECAMAERDDATLYSDEQRARADRAEAEARDFPDRKSMSKRIGEQRKLIRKLQILADGRIKCIEQLQDNVRQANARADRAEAELGKEREDRANEQKSFLKNFAELADETLAALAAQIEADAKIASFRHDENEIMRATWATPILTTLEDVAEEIRAQPHSRTALDRLLADAEAKALRRAVAVCDKTFDDAKEADVAIGAYDCRQAILALIPKEGA